MLDSEDIDILFLTETDTKSIVKEKNYQIEGFTTVLQIRKDENSYLRIIALVKNHIWKDSVVRRDLMTDTFESLFLGFSKEDLFYFL